MRIAAGVFGRKHQVWQGEVEQAAANLPAEVVGLFILVEHTAYANFVYVEGGIYMHMFQAAATDVQKHLGVFAVVVVGGVVHIINGFVEQHRNAVLQLCCVLVIYNGVTKTEVQVMNGCDGKKVGCQEF